MDGYTRKYVSDLGGGHLYSGLINGFGGDQSTLIINNRTRNLELCAGISFGVLTGFIRRSRAFRFYLKPGMYFS